MTTGIEATIASLRQQAEHARQERAKFAHQAQQAQASAEHAQGELEREFGVTTMEQGAALLETLQREAGGHADHIQQLLAGAQ